jgi:hypothetical protein
MKTFVKLGCAVAVAVLTSAANAASVSSLSFDACDGPYEDGNGPVEPDTRSFTVTLDGGATCVAAGYGNLQGSQAEADAYLPGYTYIEKNEGSDSGWINLVTGLTGDTGTITFDPSIWSNFTSLAIGLKSGAGQYDPDWVIFTITGGDTTIDWSISPTQAGGLSHVNLYGIRGGDVPVPGTLGLLGLGLAGLGMVRRRK